MNKTDDEDLLASKEQEILRLRSIVIKKEQEVKQWKGKFESLFQEHYIMEANLRKFFVEDQIRAFKRKNFKCIQWSDTSCEKSLFLRYLIGYKGYNTVRNFVPLPSLATLYRRIQNFDFLPGVCDISIEYLKYLYGDASLNEKRGCLLMDRMSVVPGEDANKNGQIVYGYDTLYNDKNIPASEGLAALFCGTIRRIKQVVGHHFTGKSVSGDNMKNFAIDLILKMYHLAGIWIDAIVCDMGPENTAMLKSFGISISVNNEYCHVPHPLDSNQKLWLIPDGVHVFKNLGNQFRLKKQVEISNEMMHRYGISSKFARLTDVSKLFNLQKKMEFKAAPQLTNRIMKPDQFEKMRVRTHTQFFNSDVSSSIAFLNDEDPEDIEKFLESAENQMSIDTAINPTVFFLRKIDQWHNFIKSRQQKINLQDELMFSDAQYFLTNSLYFFNNISFNSGRLPCLIGAKMTTNAIMEIMIHYKSIGIDKFTCGWFTQDAIENIFSVVRSVRSLPSCKEFSQQLRSQIISQCTKETNNSSYEFDDTFENIDEKCSFLKYLRNKTNQLDEPAENQDDLTEDLHEMLDGIFLNTDFDLDKIDIFFNELELNSFYYVIGFIIKSLKKQILCESCWQMITQETDVPTRYNRLNRLKKELINFDFLEPSELVFQFFLKTERIFRYIQDSDVDIASSSFPSSFTNIVLSNLTFSEHCSSLCKILVDKFINFRLYMVRKKRETHLRNLNSSKSMRK